MAVVIVLSAVRSSGSRTADALTVTCSSYLAPDRIRARAVPEMNLPCLHD